MTDSTVAYEALNLSRQNARDIVAHEDLCAERYGNIHTAIREIKGILKWAGGTGFMLIIAVLGWSISQQYAANEAARVASQTKIEMLQRQIDEARSQPKMAPPTP